MTTRKVGEQRLNLKFWQKDDDPFASLGADLSTDFEVPKTDFSSPGAEMNNPHAHDALGSYNPENPPPGMAFVPQQEHTPQTKENNWQYDVIIARLDSIKSQLDILGHRLEQVEKQQKSPKEAVRGPWYTK